LIPAWAIWHTAHFAMSFTPADSRTFFAVAGYAYAWRFL
jgi:hypothetical protein